MATSFLGQITIAGFTFAPRSNAFCNGQILPINQNTALFSLLGTTYGGNGTTNFALPNLQGRAPMSFGNGAGLTPRTIGAVTGEDSHILTANEMPAHTHGGSLAANKQACGTGPGTSAAAAGLFPGVTTRPFYADAAAGRAGANVSGTAGSGLPHENRQPFVVMNFYIALNGIYPSRN